jgi:hypothetical protein
MFCSCFLFSVQYCAQRGIRIVNEQDFLFCRFHHYIVMAVDSIMDSYFCNKKLLVDEDYYLNLWSECHFLGNETFSQVKSCLSAHISDLVHYMDFINCLPMIEYFIKYNFTDDKDICAVFFPMSLHCFLKFNSKCVVYIDMEI